MGIVLVAFLAAWTHRVPSCYHDDINLETHQLGRKLRSPIALPLRISVLDGDVLSFYVAKLAQSSRIASERVDSLAGSCDDRYPIRGTFFGCCASAMTATASITTATRIDGTAAFFITHLVSSVIYHAYGSKEKRYLRLKGERVSSKRKTRFALRLN